MTVVFVDVGGTLWPDSFPSSVGDHQERVARLRDCAGGLSELLAAEVIESLSEFAHPPSGRQQTTAFVVETLARFGLEGVVPPGSAIDAMCLPAAGRIEPFPGAQEFLELVAKRARVVVVSNVIWRGRDALRRDFEHFGLASHISEYLTSLDVGWRKPDDRIFEMALGLGGTPPERCLMVGNSEVNDILPAIRLGMTAIRVAIEEPKPSASAANHVFTSLEQMTDFLVSQRPFSDLLPPSHPGN